MKRLLVSSSGGDCAGINAVIRALVKRASLDPEWKVYGSIEGYNSVMQDKPYIMPLDLEKVAGIHVKGGTIIKTTNKSSPLTWPVQQADGTWTAEDKTKELAQRLKDLAIDALVSIGGDGTQEVSLRLFEHGVPIIGVPKTIDNDLSGTEFTFGFQTAVQTAVDCLDRLVSTAESHKRVLIMEVMGREAGWIALHTAIAGGAEVCLIPEIPYDVEIIKQHIDARYQQGKTFANVVIAEGAVPLAGHKVSRKSKERGYANAQLGGVAYHLSTQLKAAGLTADIRETVLGHIQRGGTPIAFDRLLATQFGVKAFEMALEKKFGHMVSYFCNEVTAASLAAAVSAYRAVDVQGYIMHAARGVGISFGDEV